MNNGNKKTVILRVPRIHANDAVSMDVLLQAETLKDGGWDVSILTSHCSEQLQFPVMSFAESLPFLGNANLVCINHFAGFDRDLLAFCSKFKGKMVVRYQNVTPAKWFVPYSPRSFFFALLGRLQVRLMAMLGCFDAIASASEFSNQELWGIIPKPLRTKSTVIPVLRDFRLFNKAAKNSYTPSLGGVNALFVGRVVPNKGIHHMPYVLKAWQDSKTESCSKDLKIIVVGKVSKDFERYKTSVLATSRSLGVEGFIEFRGDVDFDTLHKLYENSDLYLSLSEHEGFGVPFVEAQQANLPVVAFDRGAAKETLGKGALLVGTKKRFSAAEFSEAIRFIDNDQKVRLKLVDAGQENAERFELTKTKHTLLHYMDQF